MSKKDIKALKRIHSLISQLYFGLCKNDDVLATFNEVYDAFDITDYGEYFMRRIDDAKRAYLRGDTFSASSKVNSVNIDISSMVCRIS